MRLSTGIGFRAGILALGLAMAGATGLAANVAQAQGVLRIAMTAGDVPTTTGAPTQGLEGVRFAGYPAFEPLVMWDLRVTDQPPGIIPWLAESYSIDPSDTNKWIFKLRKDVKFHDGSPFNADAVVFNLERFFKEGVPQYDSASAPSARARAAVLASWEKIDDYTIAIFTKAPTTFFPEAVSGILMASPEQWKKLGGNWQAFGANPSGTGPFRITAVDRQSIKMVRNDDYWNKDRMAKLDGLEVYPMPEATTRLAALRSGQVDWIEVPPPDAIPGLESAGFTVATSPMPHVWPYWLQEEGDSPFKDVKVRQALNYAMDREGIVTLLNGAAEPAKGFWKPSDPRFGHPKNDYTYDPAKAKALLAEAGYPDGVKTKILISTSGSGQMLPLPMNELLQQSAKAAGFDLDFSVVEWGQMSATRNNPNAPEMQGVYGVNGSWTTADMTWMYYSFFPPNWIHYEDPEMVELMTKYKTDFTITGDAKIELLAKIHEHLVDDAPWAWIVHDVNPRAFAPSVKGYTPAQSWYTDLTTVYLEK